MLFDWIMAALNLSCVFLLVFILVALICCIFKQ